MVDAKIVEVPKQRNSRYENAQIKQNEKPTNSITQTLNISLKSQMCLLVIYFAI
jgi:hypothetical protein